MANDLTKNPIKIDTAAAVTFRGEPHINIREMIWIGMTDTHALVLTINGVDVTFTYSAAIDGKEKRILGEPFGWTDSMVVKTIPSGNLYIFLD